MKKIIRISIGLYYCYGAFIFTKMGGWEMLNTPIDKPVQMTMGAFNGIAFALFLISLLPLAFFAGIIMICFIGATIEWIFKD